jgi:hypothetical protein
VAPKVSQIREKSLQQFLGSNLGANLRAGLLSSSRINSPGTLLASAIIDDDDLSNAEAVCSQLEYVRIAFSINLNHFFSINGGNTAPRAHPTRLFTISKKNKNFIFQISKSGYALAAIRGAASA